MGSSSISLRGTWFGRGRRLGLPFSLGGSSRRSRAVVVAAATSIAIGLGPMARRWLTLEADVQPPGGLG